MNALMIKAMVTLALLSGLVAGYFTWHHHVFAQGQAETKLRWDADTSRRNGAEKKAVLQRTAENTALVATQSETNHLITKVHDAEILNLRNTLAAAPRLRVGPAFCGGLTGPANPESAGSGPTGITGGRLLPEETDRAIKQMILEIETALATGRAAQKFIRDNGMAEE